nr:MAG TPA: hypothetical protein [Caudoviricetes sp.]
MFSAANIRYYFYLSIFLIEKYICLKTYLDVCYFKRGHYVLYPSILEENYHISLIDFMNESKSVVSIVPEYLPERASFMAATVSLFGSEYIASIKVLSTKLFRLLFAFFACSCNT